MKMIGSVIIRQILEVTLDDTIIQLIIERT